MDRLASRKDALLRTETYGYDGNGNLVSFTDRKGQVSAFTYDGLKRRTFAGWQERQLLLELHHLHLRRRQSHHQARGYPGRDDHPDLRRS